MKILVTGGSGFIGDHLIRKLKNQDSVHVLNVDLRTPKQEIADEFSELDLTTEKTLKTVEDFNPDLVVNLAAQTDVNSSLENPDFTLRNNVMATFNLLRGVRSLRNRKEDFLFVHVSSDQVYGNVSPENLPIREDCPLCPYNPYGVSKKIVDELVRTFNGFFNTVVLRPSTTFGPMGSKHQVITKFLLKALNDEPIVFNKDVESNPSLSPTRDFNYIENTINGITLAIQKRARGIYNISTGKETSILQMAKMISEITGVQIKFSDAYEERKFELGRKIRLNPQKAMSELGFEPKVDLKSALKTTYDWLKKNPHFYE